MKVERTVELVNRLGLHARAASKFVEEASRFQAEIRVRHNDEEVNGKSILGLLLLAAPCGSKLVLTAEGTDAEEALAALERLVCNRFGEEH
ncbi:MAG: HPr family phosphocarrier protein [Thermoanaerobaculum sp.]|nr:HPr family phosphocarrier protein [Thermoanaerobaculum sp.]MCX7895742.1 HPr family phosphocarrier protein [Thermoanaerobaculum sp.]MDW7966963.1 HPr family phosphocarrier protein [Thermoanaerobaculum sp.]